MSWDGDWNSVPIPHSVTFGDKNSYVDWHLVPSSRPVIAMPSLKSNIVDIPGGQGSIDLSEALTGYPLYSNRTGNIDFHILNDYEERWVDLYEEITHYLHGRQRAMILADDPDWYYVGRYAIDWTSNNDGTWSDLSISYTLDPFKYSIETDKIEFNNVGTDYTYLYPLNNRKSFPITPWINITSISGTAKPNVQISVLNPDLSISYDDSLTVMGANVADNQLLYKIILSNVDGSSNAENSDDPMILRLRTSSNNPISGSIEYRRMVL